MVMRRNENCVYAGLELGFRGGVVRWGEQVGFQILLNGVIGKV